MKILGVSSATAFEVLASWPQRLEGGARLLNLCKRLGLEAAGHGVRVWQWLCAKADAAVEHLPVALERLAAHPLVPPVLRKRLTGPESVSFAAEIIVPEPALEADRLPEDAFWSIAREVAEAGSGSAERIDHLQAEAEINIGAASYALDRLIADLAPFMSVGSRVGDVLPLPVLAGAKPMPQIAPLKRVSRAA